MQIVEQKRVDGLMQRRRRLGRGFARGVILAYDKIVEMHRIILITGDVVVAAAVTAIGEGISAPSEVPGISTLVFHPSS